MCYLGTIYFFYVRFSIGASSVMVSWLVTYGAAAKLRASCECAHRTVPLVGCWYQGRVMIHCGTTLMVILRGPSLE
jgi:hypothetical protein